MVCGKRIALVIIQLGMILLSTNLYGQPAVCEVANPDMTPTCLEACIICDIDGFTGRHQSDVVGSLPDDFCTLVVHNAQWIAFQAASVDLRIRMTVSNCEIGSGLELAIYRSQDCEDFTLISNCRGAQNAVPEGSTAEFENTEPLIIGQFYYLAMDGNRADNCDWTLEVLEGSTETAPLTETAPIEGPDRFCVETVQTYSTAQDTGAVLFDWTLDGQLLETTSNPEITLDIDTPDFYELCVSAKNVCDVAVQNCRTIEAFVIPITPVIDVFCEGECFEIDGNVFCDEGLFEFAIPLDNGCDSIISLDLTMLAQPITDLALNICEGDTIRVGDEAYSSTGAFTTLIQGETVCDSMVNLDLRIIICNIESSFSVQATTCHGDADGSVSFNVDRGTPPFTVSWTHLQTNMMGSAQLNDVLEPMSIDDLPPGDLIVEINDDFGNMDVLIVVITEPDPIDIAEVVSDFNGFGVSCHDSSDGSISVLASGGTPPYNYEWSHGVSGANVDNLTSGNYTVELSDSQGCIDSSRVMVTSPDSIGADIVFEDPSCESIESGVIRIDGVSGGVGPYEYALNNSDFNSTMEYQDLRPQMHTIFVRDANGCMIEQSDLLVAPQIPELIGATRYELALGCEVTIELDINDVEIEQIDWLDDSYLDCDGCIDPVAQPLNSGQNVVSVMSIDGCTDSLAIDFEVEKQRTFYAPNIFNPNAQSRNAMFTLVGGKEVLSFDLSIYDRWGGRLFQRSNMVNADDGWDGTSDGLRVQDGIYIWQAVITFIDGVEEAYSGDVMLIR